MERLGERRGDVLQQRCLLRRCHRDRGPSPVTKLPQRVRPRHRCVRHRERRSHRCADRLAVQRVGTVGLQQDSVHPRAAALRKMEPTLSTFPTRSRTTSRCTLIPADHGLGANHASLASAAHPDGQAPAMKVETGDAVHHRLRHDVNREYPVDQRDPAAMPTPVP